MRSTADAIEPFSSFLRPFWLGEELARRGNEVTHFCPAPPGADGLSAAYVRVRGGKGIVTWAGIKEEPANLRRLQAVNPNILYVHRTVNAGFLVPRLLRTYPSVVDAHSSEYMEYKAYGQLQKARKARILEALTLSTATCVVAASTELKEYLSAEYDLDPSTIFVVPNGMPTETLRKAPVESGWKRRLGLAGHEQLVLTSAPGRFAANDLSMAFLAEVSDQARKGGLPARFIVTGRSAAPEGVRPMGVVEDYIGLIDAADVTLLPYPPTAVCGGARLKTLEFMARGKPIVSTKEGMRGVVDAKPGVHYVPVETPSDVILALDGLRQNPERRERLGQAARLLAERYLWSGSAERLEEILRGFV